MTGNYRLPAVLSSPVIYSLELFVVKASKSDP